MGRRTHLLFGIIFATFYLTKGCQIDGITNWLLPVSESILDTYRGSVYSRSTSNIEGINSVNFFEGLNGGPYLDVSFTDSQFNIVTNAAFANYEENETAQSFSFTTIFRCTGGGTSTLVFLMNIIDTNNNAPQFMPSSTYEFTIAPPVPPGFLVTGCLNDITVRDIDLTTQRIDYEIEDNEYFMIEYDAASSTVAKEFKASLKTTSFIRSIPEPITLRITATDLDLTGDPRRSTTATVTIIGDSEFEFPEEPVFSQPFYFANYTNDHRLIVHDIITLQQGHDNQVLFSLEGEYSRNFGLADNGNQISISVETQLPTEVMMQTQIILVVRASREYTTGDTATIIVLLPEAASLEFERAHYEGSIVNNALQLSPLTLSQGYDISSLFVTIISEYSSYFSVSVQGNLITLTMTPLAENIIDENNFLNLQVVASNGHSSASAIVTLEIIKDDNLTPVFNSPIFTGTYDSTTGLSIPQIVIVQGYDETVSVSLDGEHASYFQIAQTTSVITLTSSTIPPELFSEQRILLSVKATKPRTVGANAAVVIDLPAARELNFEAPTYKGSVRDNVLILETIILSVGYDENVNFALTGDLASYFTVSHMQNQVSVQLATELPADFITANNNILLTLTASGLNSIPISVTILLKIIKEDSTTPIFNQNIFNGIYTRTSGNIEIENINLVQGYDATVTFRIEGEHSQYFTISNTGNSVILSVQSAIPEEVIFNEKVLSFTIRAEKDLTVGANAAILIRFPSELTEHAVMRFGQKNYIGLIEDNNLSLENIVLDTGYAEGTEFLLTGDYSSYFSLAASSNTVSVLLSYALPDEIVQTNSFIVLDMEAQRERAISTFTSIIIDIKYDVIAPVFSKPYYSGVYTEENGLQFEDEISLALGYDETVSFTLEGERVAHFMLVQNGNSLTIHLLNPIPETILQNNNHLTLSIIANKPVAESARSAIFIDLPKDVPEQIVLRFEESSYVGTLHNGELQIPAIRLTGEHSDTIHVDMTGDYASYFTLSIVNNVLNIQTTGIPAEVINEEVFIILNLAASYPEAVTGFTTLIIEISKDTEPHILTPLFERAFYTGEYSEENGLIFDGTIELIQGFNESVTFTLSGDDSQWFIIVQQNVQNSLTLAVRPDSAPNISDKSHFVFSIVAEKPGSLPGQAAVVISITDMSIDTPLRFTRDFYTGYIENSNLTLEAIRLEEGYSNYVTYSLLGDYSDFFQLTNQDGIFTIQLTRVLPAEVLEANNILVFTLQVHVENTRAHTSIILELITSTESEVTLAFEETYYVGLYSESSGFNFNEQIRLRYETTEAVQFSLSGGYNELFEIVYLGDYISIILISPLPTNLLDIYHQLIFNIEAQSSGRSATATIVISLIQDIPNVTILGFERVNYIGSIQNDMASLQQIILTDGYTDNVEFILSGEMAEYFQMTTTGPIVTVVLNTAIPELSIPENGFTMLDITATAPSAITAYATIVFEFVREDAPAAVELIFNEAFYTGTFSEEGGLSFATPVSLSAGFDENVSFALEGGDSQWFALLQSGNSVSLTLINSIPAAVLSNNQHLLFVITAQRAGSTTASATIIISLQDEYSENNILGFDRVTYVGTIENNIPNIQPITLSEGYTEAVTFTISGELASYFRITSVGPVVSITLQTAIPEQSIPENGFTWLDIRASAPPAMTAYATIVFEFVREDAPAAVELIFNEAFYTGTYSEEGGLSFATPVSLSAGFDENVSFALEGGDSQWFALLQSGNSVSLTLINSIPAAVLSNNQHLLFVITAQRAGSTTASATIIISLQDEYSENNVLGFDRVTYVGTIENNIPNIQPITLSEGYTEAVTFTISGELASYFRITSVGPVVSITLQTAIPEQSIPENGFTWLDIRATAPPAMTAYATIVFEFVREDAPAAVELIFNEAFYTGTYSEEGGLSFATPVSLSAGFDENVSFALEGGDSQWFALLQSGNSVSLTLINSIPAAVLSNNQHLLFVITAQRAGSTTASATIIISLQDEYSENNILGFDRVTYVGTIENNIPNIQPITLSEGYTEAVTFTISGELASYFRITSVGPVVSITLQTAIPEQSIPENGFTWLDIRASAPPAMTAYATIVFEFVREDAPAAVELIFNEAFYTGTYSEEGGLSFATPVSLSAGFDENVSFALEGGDSQWFALLQSGNSVSLTLINSIPAAVLSNNQHLLFVITAQRAGSTTASATIIISLQDEYSENNVLGFDRVTYVGTIENNIPNIQPITLSEGYTEAVTFTISGELASYFRITSVGPVVSITLQTAIPEQSIPENGFTWLDIRASAPPAMTAYATIVFEFVREDAPAAVELIFNEAFYTGTYSEEGGLSFATPVSLSAGFDENVSFALEGGDSQWFALLQSGNSVSLTLINSIPAAVLSNNQHLLFVITAQRAGSTTASATIIISLQDEYSENNVLGFDRVTYVGTIENNIPNIQPITLSEGYTEAVTFTISGELASYFRITSVGPVVSITLQTAIPEQSIPENGFTWLDIRATAPPAMTAYATIVFEFVREDAPAAVELIFNEAFYTGTYSEEGGLSFATPVSLSAGFDENVSFALEGGDSQWFALLQSGNSVSLTLINSIPAAVLSNNQHLLFVITAQRAGSTTASATIIISLQDEYSENNILGFDRVTYVGTIENNIPNIQPITLSEGYTEAVTFTISGELASYFRITSVGPVVSITLQTAIPEQSIPENGFTWLDIRASAPPAMTAYATIVFEFVREDAPAAVELIFNEAFYTGTYTEEGGLSFATPVSLSAGFDENVSFALEGGDSQWFALLQSGNSVSLTLINSIPAAVLSNNQHLLFVITAQRAGSTTASATIIISLQDEYSENNVLGFDRVTYVGTIENNIPNIQPITLSEGYTEAVTFTISGELASYFRITSVGPVVSITLQTAIPEQSIPENGFTWLDIRASAPPAMTAYATIVFEFVREDAPAAVELIFNEAFYTGTYSEEGGLSFATPVSLSAGFDENVSFALEGGDSQWFALLQSGNSVSLTLINSIPAAVLSNNQHLLFVITAQRAGSTTASATIIISLQDEYSENNVLGFDRVTYVGTIENNIPNIQPITLSEGYTEAVTFTISGELASYFRITSVGPVVSITLQTAIPEQSIPENGFTWLDIRASAPPAMTAYATIVFEFVREDAPAAVELIFNEAFYTGTYSEEGGLSFATPVSLSAGFDENVSFTLDGENSRWFFITMNGNSVTLGLATPIPDDVLTSHHHLIFVIIAQRPGSTVAKATIVISLDDAISQTDVTFGKVLYEGLIQLGVVQHESITISGFTGTTIQLLGEYANAFESRVSNGIVTIQRSGTVTLPVSVTLVVLELHADGASAVLLLNVVESENPVLPSVSFGTPSYALRVGDDQTGVIGRVEATADNRESLVYSLLLENAHLQTLISINNEGEINLSAPADIGAYSFQVVATTIITQVSGSATVSLSVETITTCEENNIFVPPLITLNRDEEESHENLVVLDGSQFEGCRYTLINRWPADQTWLYVDDIGLHTRAIDREHESIAFMALSQVQVELILHCDSDPATRTKRSIESKTENWLGPYDYGTKNWIITDTIPYNSRTSFVNLIVNDINDNYPIFDEKQNEPIVVGYPVPELEDTVLPRSLAELKATDADIGENAALLYWSSEADLAVAPLTGFVHVRDGARLEHDSRLTVNATDRNGEGLTGSIDLQVKLLDVNNIIVVTVRDAFLDDEKTILANLSAAVGYDVKVLSSAVISDDTEDVNSRTKREITYSVGASLQLYVYGLIEREPVAIERLITDINNNAVATIHISNAVSLEDHLEGQEIPVIAGRDVGLLVSTIVLSILLFILIVLIVLWFCRKWIWRKNYQEFSDENSIASRSESLSQPSKLESGTKPRLNIEELKRSERRLQEMLDAPVRDVVVEPTTVKMETPLESKVDMTIIDPRTPIVIQSIDKLKDGVDESSSDDEFGEKQKAKRKSVVTFNENVEKIIHVDDSEDVSPESDYEIFKL